MNTLLMILRGYGFLVYEAKSSSLVQVVGKRILSAHCGLLQGAMTTVNSNAHRIDKIVI